MGRFVRFLFASSLALWSASDVVAQDGDGVAGDVTSVQVAEADPLAWIGAHEVSFVARVRDEHAELRSGPDPNHRVVRRVSGGTLLLVVGDGGRGYLRVLVPSGYRAFIHGRYVDFDQQGLGTVNADRVNVRSIPSSVGDYPIGQVSRGRSLMVWGPAGSEWLEVTAPGDLPLWITGGSINLVGDLDEALAVEVAEARAARLAEWETRTEEARTRSEERHAVTDAMSRLAELRAAVLTEQSRGGEADFTATSTALAAIRESVTDEAVLRAVDAQQREIDALQRAADLERERRELARQLDAERERLEQVKKEARVRRFRESSSIDEKAFSALRVGDEVEWVGFLRVRPDDDEHPVALEQGTRLVGWLTCSTGRLRLADFGGRQVAVMGRVTRLGSAPKVDVVRLEILR